MRYTIIILIAALALAGCQTTKKRGSNLNSYLDTWQGAFRN